ncbi:NXPE family member 4 [Aplysia californica]|uniref:NXPE family member 4 n=1 Tax=Aplysia californica TaxID=6500 RepID=A0ABM0ZVL7_APLCA|nr:NXPE family member 4 [Aplysia californica]
MAVRIRKLVYTATIGIVSFTALWIFTSTHDIHWHKTEAHFSNDKTKSFQPANQHAAVFPSTNGMLSFSLSHLSFRTTRVQASFDNDLDFYPTTEVDALYKRVVAQPKCKEMLQATADFWRSTDGPDYRTSEADYQRIAKLMACGLPVDPKFLKAPPTTKLYDFERRYLTQPPLTNRSLASSEFKSVVHLLGGRTTFEVGENVTLRVDMKDGQGRPKVSGGDEVRVWFKDVGKKKSVAANVLDLGNGSYLATGLLPWEGKVKVQTVLAHSSAYIRAVIQTHLLLKTFARFTGIYTNDLADEATFCSHLPYIPHHEPEDICNLTEINGSPWFCAWPIKKQLSCQDFRGTRELLSITDWRLPVTSPELAELERSCKDPRMRFIKPSFELTVKKGAQPFPQPTIPCHKLPPRQTWTQHSPTGFLSEGTNKWNFLSCRKERPKNCFQNLTLHIVGDSNSRHHLNRYCTAMEAVWHVIQTKKAWHAPLRCSHTKAGFTADWNPHANPFSSSSTDWAMMGSLVPSSHVIDSIPAETPGRVLLVLHHYFHLVMHHVTAFHNMVIASRDAVARLLDRNPNVQVLVQGPHVTYVGWPQHYVGGDGLARFMEEILIQEYRPLRDRVVYLRTWETTLAMENHPFHPQNQNLIDDMILDLMCGR